MLRVATPGNTGPTTAPALLADAELGVRIHESLVNAAARAEFGGRAFTLDGISKVYEDLTRGLLRDARKEADQQDGLKRIEKLLGGLAGKPVTITLAKNDPLTLAFTEQGFSVEVHIASIRQDKESLAGLRIKAAYRLENTKIGVLAVRKQPVQFIVEAAHPEKKQAKLPDEALHLQETLFGEVFKERLALAPLPLPEGIAKLQLPAARASARNGWFTLAWGR